MKTEFTRGPWEITPMGVGSGSLEKIKMIAPEVVAISTPLKPWALGETTIFCVGSNAQANAGLIATAPEMFERLQSVADMMACDSKDWGDIYMGIRDTLARAKGEKK